MTAKKLDFDDGDVIDDRDTTCPRCGVTIPESELEAHLEECDGDE